MKDFIYHLSTNIGIISFYDNSFQNDYLYSISLVFNSSIHYYFDLFFNLNSDSLTESKEY